MSKDALAPVEKKPDADQIRDDVEAAVMARKIALPMDKHLSLGQLILRFSQDSQMETDTLVYIAAHEIDAITHAVVGKIHGPNVTSPYSMDWDHDNAIEGMSKTLDSIYGFYKDIGDKLGVKIDMGKAVQTEYAREIRRIADQFIHDHYPNIPLIKERLA